MLNVTILCVKFLSNKWMVFSALKSKLYKEIITISISGITRPSKNDIKKNFLLGNKNFILNARYVCSPIKDIDKL